MKLKSSHTTSVKRACTVAADRSTLVSMLFESFSEPPLCNSCSGGDSHTEPGQPAYRSLFHLTASHTIGKTVAWTPAQNTRAQFQETRTDEALST